MLYNPAIGGISMSETAMVSRERRIPFEINADPFYSAANIAHLARVTADIDNGTAVLSEHELIEEL